MRLSQACLKKRILNY